MVVVSAWSVAMSWTGTWSAEGIMMIMADDIGRFKVKRLQPRHHGLSHAQHRSHRQGGRDFTD